MKDPKIQKQLLATDELDEDANIKWKRQAENPTCLYLVGSP